MLVQWAHRPRRVPTSRLRPASLVRIIPVVPSDLSLLYNRRAHAASCCCLRWLEEVSIPCIIMVMMVQDRGIHSCRRLDHRVVKIMRSDRRCLVQIVSWIACGAGRRTIRAEQIAEMSSDLRLGLWDRSVASWRRPQTFNPRHYISKRLWERRRSGWEVHRLISRRLITDRWPRYNPLMMSSSRCCCPYARIVHSLSELRTSGLRMGCAWRLGRHSFQHRPQRTMHCIALPCLLSLDRRGPTHSETISLHMLSCYKVRQH